MTIIVYILGLLFYTLCTKLWPWLFLFHFCSLELQTKGKIQVDTNIIQILRLHISLLKDKWIIFNKRMLLHILKFLFFFLHYFLSNHPSNRHLETNDRHLFWSHQKLKTVFTQQFSIPINDIWRHNLVYMRICFFYKFARLSYLNFDNHNFTPN